MEQSEIIVGLDIGTTKIAALVGRQNEHGKIEILGMGQTNSVGVRRGVVLHITPTVDAITRAVEEAGAKSGVEIAEVNVGIAGQHIKSLQHRESMVRDNWEEEITQDDIDRLTELCCTLVMLPGEEIIDVLPQEYIVDHEPDIKDPIGMVGNRLEGNFHIITGQMTAIKNIYKCVRKAGLEVADLTLEPLASAEAVLSEEEKEAGVVLVDIGGGTSDVAIFHEGIIRHTAVVPFGGNIITEDIKKGCSIIASQAEKLKLKFGSTLASENQENEVVVIPPFRRGGQSKEISMKSLSHIIEARMQDIIAFVHNEIKNSGHEEDLIGGIVVTGGGSQLRHISQLFEYEIGMDTRIGYPTEHLAHGMEEVTSPMYSTGVGLVIKGIQYLEKQKSKEKLSNRSKKDRGSFFDKLFNKGREWFEEDSDDEDRKKNKNKDKKQ